MSPARTPTAGTPGARRPQPGAGKAARVRPSPRAGRGWKRVGIGLGLVLGLALVFLGSRALGPGAALGTKPPLRRAPSPTTSLSAAEQEVALQAQQQELAMLAASLREAGAHGPLGAVPPMLEVRDEGGTVTVRNLRNATLKVSLAKVAESPHGSGRYEACPLDAEQGRRDRGYDHLLPKETVTFRLSPFCDFRFRKQPIEYRVGRAPGDQAWWSETALGASEGHPQAR